jgi:LysM repeat protein
MSDESNQTNTNSEQTQPTGQPVRAVPERAPVRSQPVQTASQPVDVRRPAETKSSNLGEYVKFGILAVILLGTPVVIALLIPLIFGQIVPAVLGSNLAPDIPLSPADQVVEPESAETPGVILPGGPETGIGGEATPTGTPAVQEPAATEVLVHLVRTGETLESIARQYGITSAAIVSANNIQNPNQIFVGTILIIPSPTNPYP